jgi:hypothetical protein
MLVGKIAVKKREEKRRGSRVGSCQNQGGLVRQAAVKRRIIGQLGLVGKIALKWL